MSDSNEFRNLQHFLDNVQYNKNGLQRYQWIFGEGFLSTGGIETTRQVLSRVKLGPGYHVLDIGSGCGGHAMFMAETFGCFVHGIDLSQNMMSMALAHLEARSHLKDLVKFEIKDCTTCDMKRNHYDLIYSRDAIMHIENKRELFANIMKWLKPGGVFLVTDYVRGEDESKYLPEFRVYLRQRNYHLSKPSEYYDLLVKSGFNNVKIDDWNDKFRESLHRELHTLHIKKGEFLEKFTIKDYEDLQSGWMDKLKRIDEENQGWILGYAQKPFV